MFPSDAVDSNPQRFYIQIRCWLYPIEFLQSATPKKFFRCALAAFKTLIPSHWVCWILFHWAFQALDWKSLCQPCLKILTGQDQFFELNFLALVDPRLSWLTLDYCFSGAINNTATVKVWSWHVLTGPMGNIHRFGSFHRGSSWRFHFSYWGSCIPTSSLELRASKNWESQVTKAGIFQLEFPLL